MDNTDALATTPAIASARAPRSAWGRRTSLAVATAVATLVAGVGVVGLAPAAHASGSDNAAFLGHLNSLRAAHGLPRLAVASDLTSIATTHSQQMMARQTIFHNPSLTSQVSNWQVLGENVGMGGSVAAIDTAFDRSPEHYANEVSSAYTQVGIGTAWDSRGYLYVTLDFRKPMHTTAAPVVRPPAPKPAAPKAPVVRPAAPKPPVAATQRYASPSAAAAGSPRQPSAPAQRSPASAAATAAATAAAAARQIPTVVPGPVTGSDPVANALAFSRLLAGMR